MPLGHSLTDNIIKKESCKSYVVTRSDSMYYQKRY